MTQTGVYIIKCNNSRFYIGSTINLERRMTEHSSGRVRATKNILPIKLVFFQSCGNPKEARQLEHKIKTWKNRALIEQVIKDGYIRADLGL